MNQKSFHIGFHVRVAGLVDQDPVNSISVIGMKQCFCSVDMKIDLSRLRARHKLFWKLS